MKTWHPLCYLLFTSVVTQHDGMLRRHYRHGVLSAGGLEFIKFDASDAAIKGVIDAERAWRPRAKSLSRRDLKWVCFISWAAHHS